MSKFKVRDRGRVRNDLECGHIYCMEDGSTRDSAVSEMIELAGKYVTITEVQSNKKYFVSGGKKWNFTDEMLEPAEDRKILITTDGPTTLARLYEGKKVVKSAKAVCSPEDTFDFNKGAQLACNRLMYGTDYNPAEVAFKPESKPDPEPVKLYCVRDESDYLTKGKVYEFDGHQLNYDNGHQCWHFDNYEAWKKGDSCLAACLVPLVSRPAKVGDWVYFVQNWGGPLAEGSVHRVAGDHYGTLSFVGNAASCSVPDAYLVLDGYCPEPETCKCCGQVINK
mgnify:CR=1 FL=1